MTRLLQLMDLANERERVQQWEADQKLAKLCWWIHKIGHFDKHLSWEEWIRGTDLDRHPDAVPDPTPKGTPGPHDELLATEELREAFSTLQLLGVAPSAGE